MTTAGRQGPAVRRAGRGGRQARRDRRRTASGRCRADGGRPGRTRRPSRVGAPAESCGRWRTGCSCAAPPAAPGEHHRLGLRRERLPAEAGAGMVEGAGRAVGVEVLLPARRRESGRRCRRRCAPAPPSSGWLGASRRMSTRLSAGARHIGAEIHQPGDVASGSHLGRLGDRKAARRVADEHGGRVEPGEDGVGVALERDRFGGVGSSPLPGRSSARPHGPAPRSRGITSRQHQAPWPEPCTSRKRAIRCGRSRAGSR